MKEFLDGFLVGMKLFGFIAGGAIGGMILYRGLDEHDSAPIVLGIFVIVINMLSNAINHMEGK